MTYKDLLKRDHPEKVNSQFYGGCSGCPHDYNYCLPEDCMCHKTKFKNFNRNTTCTQCWLQEVPGTETKKTERLPPDKKKELKATYAYFKDGHKEEILYCSGIIDTVYPIDFVTESGIYVYYANPRPMELPNLIKYNPYEHCFYKTVTYLNFGVLNTQTTLCHDIDHIEFEEVEVDA